MFTIGKNSFVVANSNNLRNAVYRLRYKVYVEKYMLKSLDLKKRRITWMVMK